MNAVEHVQHSLFDCPLYTGIRQQHTALFGPDQSSSRLFLERNADKTASGCPLHSPMLSRQDVRSHLAPHYGL